MKTENKKSAGFVFTRLVALVAALLAALTLVSCGSSEADDSEVLAALPGLLEKAAEIDDIFYGDGLPVYERDSLYAAVSNLYKDDESVYDYITKEAKYQSIAEIKSAAEEVYTAEYLAGPYTTVFGSYYDETTGSVYARYREVSSTGAFQKCNAYTPFYTGEHRKYDADSATIQMKNRNFVTVIVKSERNGVEIPVTLRLAKVDGKWLLDTPTY